MKGRHEFIVLVVGMVFIIVIIFRVMSGSGMVFAGVRGGQMGNIGNRIVLLVANRDSKTEGGMSRRGRGG